MQRTRVATATRGAWAALAVLAFTLVPAAKAPAADGQSRILIPAAGWHGRPIQQPHNHTTLTVNRRPTGWSAGPVRLGTGLHSPRGSDRVRELQQRLRRLGYRPGAVDGIYGPRTRAAMGWFRRKHGFRVVGPPSLAAVVHLRERTTPRTVEPTPEVTPEPPSMLPTTQTAALPGDGGFNWWPWILAALVVAVAAGALVARRHPRPASAAASDRKRPRALGYIRVGADDTFDASATAIEQECDARGLALEGLVSDELDDRRGHQRPGLAYALERLEADGLDCLVVGRIEQLADRQVDLHDVLARISRRGAVLVVLNVGPHLPPAARRWAPEAPRRVMERSDA